jgi:hypothetical protein
VERQQAAVHGTATGIGAWHGASANEGSVHGVRQLSQPVRGRGDVNGFRLQFWNHLLYFRRVDRRKDGSMLVGDGNIPLLLLS